MSILTNFLSGFKKEKKQRVSDTYEMELSVYLNSMAIDSSWSNRREYLRFIMDLLNTKYGFNLRMSKGNQVDDQQLLKVLKKLKTYDRNN